MPTLIDGDLVLTESAAILLYLADRYPDVRLASTDRALLYRWLVFLTNTVQTTMLHFFYPERYGSEGVQELAASDAAGYFELLDRNLAGRKWLVGDHRTAADLFLFMVTRWGRRLEPAAWELPNFRAHFVRAFDCPASGACWTRELDLPAWAATPR